MTTKWDSRPVWKAKVQTPTGVVCWGCRRWIEKDEPKQADLNGPPNLAYYCNQCALEGGKPDPGFDEAYRSRLYSREFQQLE